MRLSRGWDGLKGADAAAEAKQEISGNKNDDADIQEQPESESMLNEEARASLVIVLKYRSRKPYQAFISDETEEELSETEKTLK
jgi:hypothetical protein